MYSWKNRSKNEIKRRSIEDVVEVELRKEVGIVYGDLVFTILVRPRRIYYVNRGRDREWDTVRDGQDEPTVETNRKCPMNKIFFVNDSIRMNRFYHRRKTKEC